jgi:hypothetical protein
MLEGFVVLSKTNNVTAPASGATATLFTTVPTGQTAAGRGARYKKLIINVESSADSAANGLVVAESDDGGTTWKTVYEATYTASGGRLKVVINEIGAPELRVTFANSAATLTTWRFSVLADCYEQTI